MIELQIAHLKRSIAEWKHIKDVVDKESKELDHEDLQQVYVENLECLNTIE